MTGRNKLTANIKYAVAKNERWHSYYATFQLAALLKKSHRISDLFFMKGEE